MSYVPNPSDPTEPVASRTVESAAREFREIKGLLARSLSFPAADTPTNRGLLPPAADRAGRVLQFNAVDGKPEAGPFLPIPVNSVDSQFALYRPAGAGAVATNVQSKLREFVSVKDFGAVGDGVADDAPALRNAMAVLVARGGGYLYIPAGTYYLNSGDPRGLNMLPTTGQATTYTICEVGDGVTVYGDGDKTVLLYESNRVGEFINADSLGIFRGDVGALFANFRVRQNNNDGYAVSHFQLRDLKVSFTPLANTAKDFIDGQVLRIRGIAGGVRFRNGSFVVENVTVTNNPGHQIYSVEQCDSFTARDTRTYRPGFSSNPANTDFSAFFVTGTTAQYINNYCLGSSPDKNSTFIESHCKYNIVSDNVCEGMFTFCNAVSQIVHPAPEYDYSEFLITKNIANGCSRFVVDWCYDQNRKALLSISGNTVRFKEYTNLSVEQLVVFANDLGHTDAQILPTRTLEIKDNNAFVELTTNNAIDDLTTAVSLISNRHAETLIVDNNQITNARRSVININTGTTNTKRVQVTNNTFVNVACQGSNTNNTAARVSRTAVVLTQVPSAAIGQIDISNNKIELGFVGSSASYGVTISNFTGAQVPTKVSFVGNSILGANTNDLLFEASGANTFANDSVYLEHTHRVWGSAAAYASMALNGLPTIASVRAGSKGLHEGVTSTISFDGTTKYHSIVAYLTAIPTTRFWPRGTIAHNVTPSAGGAPGWVCVTAGTPGTWRAMANLAA